MVNGYDENGPICEHWAFVQDMLVGVRTGQKVIVDSWRARVNLSQKMMNNNLETPVAFESVNDLGARQRFQQDSRYLEQPNPTLQRE